MKLDTRTAASPLRVVHAARTVVIAGYKGGDTEVYISTAVGWRVQREPGRLDGELVIEPLLCALLDAAAQAA